MTELCRERCIRRRGGPIERRHPGLCNDYEQHVAWAEYRALMDSLDLPLPAQQSERDLPQADDIRVKDLAPVMRAAGNAVELTPMRFGFPPARPNGAPARVLIPTACGCRR